MKRVREWKKATKWLFAALSLVIAVLFIFSISSFFILSNNYNKAYEPVKRIPSRIDIIPDENQTNKTEKENVQVFLILGIDRRPNDIGRTDTIMLAIVNDSTKNITLLSIPRDTYVEIAGKDYKDKINHAYQYGVEITIATVENFTEIPVDNYILFTFEGFIKTVDAIGGITVNVDNNVAEQSKKELSPENRLIEGEMLLNGKQALYYSRFRGDAKGDLGRNDRQQQVLQAFIDQSKSFATVAKINELLKILGSDLRTDLTLGEMGDLAIQMLAYSSNDVTRISYNGEPGRFGEQNLWYLVVSEEERQRVTTLLRESLSQ